MGIYRYLLQNKLRHLRQEKDAEIKRLEAQMDRKVQQRHDQEKKKIAALEQTVSFSNLNLCECCVVKGHLVSVRTLGVIYDPSIYKSPNQTSGHR